MFGTASPTLFAVLADPGPDREAELHHWYDHIHGPDALANGSFHALNRYRARGAGWSEAPLLALWEGGYHTDAEAWDYIRPRAEELRRQGRIGDIPSAVYALMLFHSATIGTTPSGPVRSLITVQNDWREPHAATGGREWFEQVGLAGVALGPDALAGQCLLYSGDPDGPGPGRHLALFESGLEVADATQAWRQIGGPGAPGMSPTPVFHSAFEDGDVAHGPETSQQPSAAPAWVMCWEPIARLG